jgi:Fe-S oxidoreductase
MWTYADLKPLLFGAFLSGMMGFFGYSVWRLVRLARLGKDMPGLTSNPVDRFGDVFYFVFFQKRVRDHKFGWNHVVFYWAFVIITIGHAEFIVRGVWPAFSLHFLGDFLYSSILRGGDLMAFIVLFAVVNAIFRRVVIRPKHIHFKSVDAFRILGMITWVMLSYFAATGAGIAAEVHDIAPYAKWLPVSSVVAHVFDPAYALIWHELWWWAHAFILLSFLNYLPYSKHMHLLGAIPNIYLNKKHKPKSALETIDFETAETFGVGKVTEFPWKTLVDTYACTECGRCDLNCPANNTGKPLQPQKVLHDIRDNLYVNGGEILRSRGLFTFQPADAEHEPSLALISESEETAQKGQISPEVLWSCTTCGACVDACPVLIDHVDAILDMRRYLVLTEGAISPELANTYKNIENNYNPWGIGADKRGAWAEAMGLKFWGSSEDASKYEYLFWVGCAGSYDNRAQKTMKALTQILDAAELSYAILGHKEKCTGDPARRTGNEYMFADLAQQNVTTLNELGVKKIVTACPHCFNALKNEYPAFGGDYEVVHHTQLIDQLLTSDRIALDDGMMAKVTFHDPCYLGRWNDEYDAPRRSLAASRRLNIVEMEASQRTSMCCGAGGGQMWMEEQEGEKRVNTARTEQALATGADTIAVGCPFCMTMLEDGVKEKSREDVKVLDVAEVIAAALVPCPGKGDKARGEKSSRPQGAGAVAAGIPHAPEP